MCWIGEHLHDSYDLLKGTRVISSTDADKCVLLFSTYEYIIST